MVAAQQQGALRYANVCADGDLVQVVNPHSPIQLLSPTVSFQGYFMVTQGWTTPAPTDAPVMRKSMRLFGRRGRKLRSIKREQEWNPGGSLRIDRVVFQAPPFSQQPFDDALNRVSLSFSLVVADDAVPQDRCGNGFHVLDVGAVFAIEGGVDFGADD